MQANIRSAVVAGLIAFVIYVVIALLTGAGAGAAFGVGALFFVGTAAITFAVILVIGRGKARARG